MRASIRYSKCLFFAGFIAILLGIVSSASAELKYRLVVHDALVAPIPEQSTYNVDLFVSVLDENNSPIENVKPDYFSLLEDSREVNFSLEPVKDMGLNIVLVFDTSGSMAGEGITKARTAAQHFIDQLGPQDQLAIIRFDDEVSVLSDFSRDIRALKREIADLKVKPNGGTCLFDAAYRAVEMSSLSPQGRRAVIVLTDGRDELRDGSVCSSMKMNDVIATATQNINTPIYSIAIGKAIDENSLERLALLTGGVFQKSDAFGEVERMFEVLQQQLRSQYQLSYVSQGAPGQHTLTVQVAIGDSRDLGTRSIVFPEPLPTIKIVSPADGANLSLESKTKVLLVISGQGNLINKVQYEINGVLSGEDSEDPYEFELDPAQVAVGNVVIAAKAYDASGNLLSSSVASVNLPPPPTAAPTPTIENTPASTAVAGESTRKAASPNLFIFAGAGVGGLLIIAALVMVIVKPFGARKAEPIENSIYEETAVTMAEGDLQAGAADLAVLYVLASDDPARKSESGKVIHVTQVVTHFGRSRSNEVVFKDHSVSRSHAVMELKDGQFYLSEALTGDESGMKSPTFGTFVNDERLSGLPMPLKTGDEIRLGNSVKMRLEIVYNPKVSIAGPEDLTTE